MSKPLPKAPPKAAPKAKAAPAPRRDAAKKEPPKPVKAAKGKVAPPTPLAAKAAPAKAAPKPTAKPVAKAPPPAPAPKPVKTAAKPAPKPPEPVKPADPPKPAKKTAGKPVAAAPKVKAASASPPHVPESKPAKAKKAAPEAKAPPKAEPKIDAKPAGKAAKPVATEAPAKAEKPPKAPKAAKAPKAPKLPPVEAAFAKPPPSKPLAVAAGRAQPVTRLVAPTPIRVAPKPLTAPKPVSDAEIVGDAMPVPAFKAKTPDKKGMVLVGAIGGAFGVKGEVRVRAFTEKKDGVIAYGPLYGEDGKVLLRPKSWRELKDGVAVLAPEVKSKEQADEMRGQRLFVPRSNLPPTAEDEFYVVDLLGCRAESLGGEYLGDICAVWNFGAGDVIEYRPPHGPNVRVTFSRQAVPHVDLAAKRVVLDPPPPEPEAGK